ncbi:uncharacterized protein LTR77_008647 [Saxophila tyrrhenica]|uniref:Enoyl reductase (ER) domain-containing protein n=1 Tax=Saxophila tyrrhenica TaxID=1690608 RepID=A0AAV9P3Q3_9PEZI|nr:hypothetical protein LTR77_008647 [Saxophila tyrrhenica]
MKSLTLTKLGDAASSFKLEDRPVPTAQQNEVLIHIRAIGLNHAELSTRLGEPNPMGPVPLPRTLGIECVGLVSAAPGCEDEFPSGSIVIAALGGLGREREGTYAEFCVAPKENCIVVAASEGEVGLSWEVLGAVPVMLQTAWGCLFRSLKVVEGDALLVRGAGSGVGMAAIGLAKGAGATVVASTRAEAKMEVLFDAGADHVVVDDGKLQEKIQAHFPKGVDKALDLVGAVTAPDSIRCLADGGVCCSAGTLGGSWSIPNFVPNFMLPIGRYLTSYGERTFTGKNTPWSEVLGSLRDGKVKIKMGRVFRGVESIVEAHEVMERNEAGGKVVVLV